MLARLLKASQGLWRLARDPWLLNQVVAADETTWRRQALRYRARWPELTDLGLPVTSLQGLLPAAGDTVTPFGFGGGGSLPTDLLLLRALVRRAGPTAMYFEIGTWRGESAAAVAPLASRVVTLDLPTAELRRRSLPPDYIEQQGYFLRDLPNVEAVHGDSATLDLRALAGPRPFDVIFIDGDHRHEAVRHDTRRVFEELVGPTTVVVWHDAARQPGQPRWEVLAGLLAGLPTAVPGHLYAVSHALCALYVPTPLPAAPAQLWPAPGEGFSVTVQPRVAGLAPSVARVG